jgi:hypothetical protein
MTISAFSQNEPPRRLYAKTKALEKPKLSICNRELKRTDFERELSGMARPIQTKSCCYN